MTSGYSFNQSTTWFCCTLGYIKKVVLGTDEPLSVEEAIWFLAVSAAIGVYSTSDHGNLI